LIRAGRMAQVVECPSSKHKALSSNLGTIKKKESLLRIKKEREGEIFNNHPMIMPCAHLS
jgi:hypothetical protein